MKYGFSFARRQCEWLGLDWKECFTKLNSNLFPIVRLSIYWNEIEKEEGIYDFSLIKKEIELATELNKEIIVTVGMKAQRWPEFFIPVFLKEQIDFRGDVSKNEKLKAKTLDFLNASLDELNGYKNIKYWQIENEPLDPQWPEGAFIGKDFLKEEIGIFHDDSRKLMLNFWPFFNSIKPFPSSYKHPLPRKEFVKKNIKTKSKISIRIINANKFTLFILKYNIKISL